MWADNCWIFSDDSDKLKSMVSDIIDELMDLDMECHPKSLWWTSPYKAEDGVTVEVDEGQGKSWEMPFVEVLDLLECRF